MARDELDGSDFLWWRQTCHRQKLLFHPALGTTLVDRLLNSLINHFFFLPSSSRQIELPIGQNLEENIDDCRLSPLDDSLDSSTCSALFYLQRISRDALKLPSIVGRNRIRPSLFPRGNIVNFNLGLHQPSKTLGATIYASTKTSQQ